MRQIQRAALVATSLTGKDAHGEGAISQREHHGLPSGEEEGHIEASRQVKEKETAPTKNMNEKRKISD